MTSVLTKLWRGHYSLPMAFLGFFIFGYGAAMLVAAVVALILMQLAFNRLAFVFALAVLASYWLIASVGVWRSAGPSIASENWAARIEGYAARGLIALIAGYALFALVNGGALWLVGRMTA